MTTLPPCVFPILPMVLGGAAQDNRLAPLAMGMALSFAGIGVLIGALLLGAVLGLVWSHCSCPLLAAALTLVASEGSALCGGIVLGLFGLGAALPLVALAYASRRGFQSVRDKVMAHGDRVKKYLAD